MNKKLSNTNEELNLEIAERKKMENALKKYRVLFDNISDLAYICDTEGNIVFVNKVFEELTSHKVEEFLGKPFAPLFDDENLTKAIDLYTRTLKGENAKLTVTILIRSLIQIGPFPYYFTIEITGKGRSAAQRLNLKSHFVPATTRIQS